MGNIAVIGNAWLRAALRKALGAEFSTRFAPNADATKHAGEAVLVSNSTFRGEQRTIFEFESENWEGPSTKRADFLRANDVRDAVIVFFSSGGPKRAELTSMRRGGVQRIIGVAAAEADAAESDAAAGPTAEQSFSTIADWLAYPSAQAPVARFASGWPSKVPDAMDDFARDTWRFVEREIGRSAEELKPLVGTRFACAACDAVLTEPVMEVSFERAESEWSSRVGSEDESLAPPMHYFRYAGEETEATFWLRNNLLYFNSVDWFGAADNGQGMKVTCCDARPEGDALNLSCPNGHELGTLWLDCCAPQGVHVIESRVAAVPR